MTPLRKLLSGLVLSIAFLTYFLGPAFGAPWGISRYILITILVLCASLSAWIIGFLMRRKIRRDQEDEQPKLISPRLTLGSK